MLNFDVAMEVKTGNVEIIGNRLQHNGKEFESYVMLRKTSWHQGGIMTVVEINRLIDMYLNKWRATGSRYFVKPDFKTLVTELKYFTEGKSLLKRLKQACCDNSYRSNTYEKFSESIGVTYSSIVKSITEQRTDLSTMQRIVLEQVADYHFGAMIEFDECYDPEQDEDGAVRFMAELEAFDYEAWGVDKDTALDKFREKDVEHKERIRAFRHIRDQAGDALVSWTDQKITRRLTEGKFEVTRWQIGDWLKVYKNYLRSKRIKPDVAKMTKVERLRSTLKPIDSQADLLTLFKSGCLTDAEASVKKMDLETLQGIMASELSCVKDKLFDKDSRTKEWKNPRRQIVEEIVKQAVALGKTQDDHNQLMKFMGRIKEWHHIPWNYMVVNMDFLSDNDVVLVGRSSHNYETNDEFFDRVLSKLDKRVRFTIRSAITEEFLKRWNETDRIQFLKQLAKEHEETNENKIHFALDKLESLYIDLDYSKVRQVMLSPKGMWLLKYLLGCIEKHKDNDAALVNLQVNDLNTSEAMRMLKMISFQEKLKVIKEHDYSEAIEQGAFKGDELNEVLKIACQKDDTHIEAVFTCLDKNGGSPSALNKVLQEACHGSFIDDEIVVKYLDNTTKKMLIENGALDEKNPYSEGYRFGYDRYRSRRGSTEIDKLKMFFETFSRDDLIEMFGEHFYTNRNCVYMYHAMTGEEQFRMADRNKDFQRAHAEALGYPYFRKFEKNKKALKEIIGDRRNTGNDNFGKELEKIFSNAGCTIRLIFDFDDEDKASA